MFVASFFGAFLATLVSLTIFLVLAFYFDPQRKPKPTCTIDNVSESSIEDFIVDNFANIFPDLSIQGRQHPVKKGKIDLLCLDESDNYVVIEMKKGRATDNVVAQIDRYMTHVEETFAKNTQSVRGIVLAPSYDSRIRDALVKRKNISLCTFDWRMDITEHPLN